MYLATPCSLSLFVAVCCCSLLRCCSLLFADVRCCSLLFLAVPCCSSLFLAVRYWVLMLRKADHACQKSVENVWNLRVRMIQKHTSGYKQNNNWFLTSTTRTTAIKSIRNKKNKAKQYTHKKQFRSAIKNPRYKVMHLSETRRSTLDQKLEGPR